MNVLLGSYYQKPKYLYSTWSSARVVGVIMRGQTLKTCHTQSTEWNWNLTSYSYTCSNVRHVYVEHLTFFWEQNPEASNFGPLCATPACQSASLWCNRLHYFPECITLQNVAKWVVSIHAASNLGATRALWTAIASTAISICKYNYISRCAGYNSLRCTTWRALLCC